ncbi:MAG: hypothetical protein ACKVX9_13685 [Blastocatellia bacterium]
MAFSGVFISFFYLGIPCALFITVHKPGSNAKDAQAQGGGGDIQFLGERAPRPAVRFFIVMPVSDQDRGVLFAELAQAAIETGLSLPLLEFVQGVEGGRERRIELHRGSIRLFQIFPENEFRDGVCVSGDLLDFFAEKNLFRDAIDGFIRAFLRPEAPPKLKEGNQFLMEDLILLAGPLTIGMKSGE